MQVINKRGQEVELDFNKILLRLNELANMKPRLNVNVPMISQHTIKMMVNGITTRQLDNISTQYCANNITNSPDYDKMAVRLEVDNLHRETHSDYLLTVLNIDNYYVNGEHVRILNPKLIDFVKSNHRELGAAINYSRDYKYTYFGLKTLMKSYLIKHGSVIKERPQHMLMRVAIGINLAGSCNVKDVIKLYELMSKKFYTHATPTLFNAGTHRQSLSSCFLLSVDDDLSEIYRTLTQTAMISKWSGGIGIHVSQVRAKGAIIKSTNGTTEGIAPMLKIFNDSAVYVSQGGGKRKGSTAVYLETWHADIEEFLNLKKPIGDESKRARDLFLALWVCDLFMERLVESIKTGKKVMWSLFCPSKAPGLADCYGDAYKSLYRHYENMGVFTKQVSISDLWIHILEIQMESGVPYIVYKDHVNRKNNQNNLGTIKSSNLCVSKDTKVLTSEGYQTIGDITDKKVKVWNGTAFSEVTPMQTGAGQKLMRVTFDNGATIDCTEYHKFYTTDCKLDWTTTNFGSTNVRNGQQFKRTFELRKGNQIMASKWPVVYARSKPLNWYTLGYLACQELTTDSVVAYHSKNILDVMLDYSDSFIDKDNNKWYHFDNKYKTEEMPVGLQCVEYLTGCIDACGIINSNKKGFTYCLINSKSDLLNKIRMMCNTIGMSPRVKANKLCFSEYETVYMIQALSVNPSVIKYNSKYAKWLSSYALTTKRIAGPRVVSVEPIEGLHDTYCFTEPNEGKGVFNGVLTGNCAEINIYTDKHSVGVCNLASICLSKFVKNNKFDYDLLHSVTKEAVYNLNKVIDNNVYPVPEGQTTDYANRPLGLGVQSLAKVFFKLGIPFVCQESKEINKKIFETIYHAALTASCELAERDGPYENYSTSEMSKGNLQFDLWGVTPTDLHDWQSIRERIAKFGVRNSLLTALMPTASTAQIMGNTESFEPITSNIFVRNTLSGTFQVVNKYLVRDLTLIGMWSQETKQSIISNNGSVQHLDIPKKIKDVYKTVWEISQRDLIDMEADRNAYICQSTSSNRYLKNPDNSKLTSMHIYSWTKGLKTGMYYLRSQAAADAVKITAQGVKKNESLVQQSEQDEQECEMCSA
jgi:ribonucleoside-diphosphate reductase alpha chain